MILERNNVLPRLRVYYKLTMFRGSSISWTGVLLILH
jgi:hypothetical protein